MNAGLRSAEVSFVSGSALECELAWTTSLGILCCGLTELIDLLFGEPCRTGFQSAPWHQQGAYSRITVFCRALSGTGGSGGTAAGTCGDRA